MTHSARWRAGRGSAPVFCAERFKVLTGALTRPARLMPCFLALWIFPFFFLSTAGKAAENDIGSADEAALRAAHVATDGPSLLRYLRQRIPKEESSDRMAALIRQLGHDSFAIREEATSQLLVIGAAAVPSLRQATGDPDPEVRRRAQGCLLQIARIPDVY